MGEQFNIDLPPRFEFTETDQAKKDKEIEDYLNKLTVQLDEMFKRMWNRLKEVRGTHIVDADGTLADITTKFNSLLSQLETLDLISSS